MPAHSRPRDRRSSKSHSLHKPHGVVHPRVQAVGPEHFAFLCADCAKARSRIMLADFYGRVLLEPTTVEHDRMAFEAASRLVRDAAERRGVKDIIAVVERTGRYHGPIRRALAEAGFEVRIIHPYATEQYRQPADPGNKTDDTDLAAIHRAAVNGLGLLEHEPDPTFVQLQLLARHRRLLVRKNATTRQQMLEHLHSYMPGYAQCFLDVFDSEILLRVAMDVGSAAAIVPDGVDGLARKPKLAGMSSHKPTLLKIVARARAAAPADVAATLHRRLFIDLDADRRSKLRSIRAIECELSELLCRTPYVLLLGLPGINVVSAAEFAGEMGPIGRHARARAITARAGLFPSRYQSDRVDRCDGPPVRHANHALRRATLIIAENLVRLNDHFAVLAAGWRARKVDARDIRVRVANRFCRIAFHVVAGRTTYRHPSSQKSDHILRKLVRFAIEHEIAPDRLTGSLEAATSQLPLASHRGEAESLAEEMGRVRRKRGAGPRAIGEILPATSARLGVGLVASTTSGETDPT